MFKHRTTGHFTLLDILSTLGQEHRVGIDTTDALWTEGLGIPAGGCEWVDVKNVHGVDFLQGTVLGLDDEEENDPEESEEGTGKDETVVVVDIISDEGREERDEEVEKPVGGGGETHAQSSVTSWV